MKGKHFLYICIVLKVAIKCLTNFLFCLGEPKENHKKELFYGENLLCKRVRFHSNWGKQQQIQCLSAGVLKNSRVTLRGTFVCEAYPILLIVGAYCLAWQQTMKKVYRIYREIPNNVIFVRNFRKNNINIVKLSKSVIHAEVYQMINRVFTALVDF